MQIGKGHERQHDYLLLKVINVDTNVKYKKCVQVLALFCFLSPLIKVSIGKYEVCSVSC